MVGVERYRIDAMPYRTGQLIDDIEVIKRIIGADDFP